MRNANNLPTPVQKIVVFDFDGTLTKSDSFVAFIKFVKGSKYFYKNLWFIGIYWLLAKLHLKSTQKAKEAVFTRFFKGMSLSVFKTYGEDFAAQIPEILQKKAFEVIAHYQSKGYTTLIISASIENWIAPWATSVGVNKVIATRVATDATGLLTGTFLGKNCKGNEKLKQLLKSYPNLKPEHLVVYGDSSGDRELLKFARKRYWRTLEY